MMKTGFTLIELLVVVLIIGILSSVALPQYTKAVEKSRLAELMSLQNSLEKAADVYLLANGNASVGTNLLDSLDISFPQFVTSANPGGGWRCDARNICINATFAPAWLQIQVARWSKDSNDGAIYVLFSRKSYTSDKWVRLYAGGKVGLSKFGLESFGYEPVS